MGEGISLHNYKTIWIRKKLILYKSFRQALFKQYHRIILML